MAGTIVRIGRYRTTADADFAIAGPGEQLAYIADSNSQPVIIYELGAWMGRNSGSPQSRIFIGYSAGSGAGKWPGDVIATTAAFTPSTNQTTWDTGQVHTRPVTPFSLGVGNYAIGVTAYGGGIGLGMRQAAAISGQYESFWRRDISSTNPTDPIEGSKSNEGHLVAWATGEVNAAPSTPTSLSPSGSVPGTTLTPVFSSKFSDPNEVLNNGAAWDYIYGYQVRVRQGSSVKWDEAFTANASERSSRQSYRTYSGSALLHDTLYTYEIRHMDRMGSWSPWASTTFTLQGLASTDRPTNPLGFELSNQPGPVTAVYRHQNGLAANAFQVRLHSESGAIISTSSAISSTVAANGTVSIAWGSTGFGSLSYGQGYGVSIRARANNNIWAVNYSPIAFFRVNAAPSIPTIVSPRNGAASSTRPILVATASDPDPEHASSISVTAEIMNGAGSVIATRSMPWVASRGRFEYQTTTSDLAAFGNFQWRAYAYDGSRYSGNAATAAAASRSGNATFVFAAGPVVSITGPAATVSTPTPTVTWSVTFSGGATQSIYRVALNNPVTGESVYDTFDVSSSSARSHVISAENWLGGERWNNGESWQVAVAVRDSNGLWSGAPEKSVTLSYPPLDGLPLSGQETTLPGTSGTNAVLLEWPQSSVPQESFEGYQIWRSEVAGDGADISGSRILLATVTDASVTKLLDAEVTSRARYRWELIQLVRQGIDTLTSTPSSWSGGVRFDGVIIHMPYDPERMVVALRYGPAGGAYETTVQMSQRMSLVESAGSQGRSVYFGRGQSQDPSGEYGIASDDAGTADERLDRLIRIWKAQSGGEDRLPHTICWREGRGGQNGRIYGNINTDWSVRTTIGETYAVNLTFRQAGFVLGEAV